MSAEQADGAKSWVRQLRTAVLVLDAEDRPIWFNPAAEDLLGVDGASPAAGAALAGRLIGHAPWAGLLRRCRDEAQALFIHDLHWPPEAPALRLDVALTPLDDGGLLLELYDLTVSRLALEDRWSSARQALGRQVVQQLAHEIRNPLAGLRGAAQLLARDEPDPARRELGEIICSEADRLAELVDRLLGPRGPEQRSRQNLHGPVDRAWALLRREASEAVKLERDYDPSLPELMLDAARLQQVVLNLGRNALQAGASHIRIATRALRYRTWHGMLHRKAVAIEVVDDGPGVPEEIRESLFFPLVTSRADGSGLGLAIAQDLVDRHGGRIEFESRPGHTVFRVLLPLDDRPPAGNPAQSSP